MYFLVMFYVLFVCKYVLLPPAFNPIAVKYIISYIITGGNPVFPVVKIQNHKIHFSVALL